MKKIFFILIAFATAHAEPMALVAKVTPSENSGYFIFSDGTFWKVSSFVKRWRGPIEWVSGTELSVPEIYECTVDKWSFGDLFEPYLKQGNLQVNEADASNEAELKQHAHLLVNTRTHKVLFATPIHASDFMSQLYKEAYEKGHSEGYNKGYYRGLGLR